MTSIELQSPKTFENISGDEYSALITDDHKKFGRQTLAIQKMLPDIRRILVSKFDCKSVDVDELVSEVCLSMLSNRDFNAHRGGATTYIYYKCQSVWLNHHQRTKQTREVLCDEGVPEDRADDEDVPEFDAKEFGAFLIQLHGDTHVVVRLYEQLRLGYHFHQVKERLKMTSKEFADARKVLTKSGHLYLADAA